MYFQYYSKPRTFSTWWLTKASLNVLNHELGHALQTSFKGKYGNNDNRFRQLISNLSTKYPNYFKLQSTEEMLTIMSEGMKAARKNDKSQTAREFYAKNAYTTYLDEIFNEDEALRVTGVNKPQFSYDMGNGFSKNIYNYQSSNYKITSYGKMMKIVMGEDLTFKAMYEDSIVAYEFFDQFKDISDKIYQGNPPMFNVLDSLNKIKRETSLNESLKLDLFLTACLQKRVAHDLKNPNLTPDDIDKIKNYVLEFNKQMNKNPNLVTQQDKIILNINDMIREREKQLSVVTQNPDTNKNNPDHIQIVTPLYRHPKADELNEIERKKQIAKQNNDISLYKQLQSEIENIIRTNRAQVTTQQWEKMNIDERRSFIQLKIMEAKVLKDENEFNYWNANLDNLNSKAPEEPQIKVSQESPHDTISTQDQNKENISNPHDLNEHKDYNYYFNEMLEAIKRYNPSEQMTEDQKKQLIGEIFYNEGFLIESLTNDEEIRQVMTRSVNELSNNEMQIKLQNIILTEMQDKYKQLHSEVNKQEKIPKTEVKKKDSSNDDLDLSKLIEQLRNELTKIQEAYHSMMGDGYIDDEELATLIAMSTKIINDGYSLKQITTNPSDLKKVSIIINSLEEQQKKMKTMLNGIEEIAGVIR